MSRIVGRRVRSGDQETESTNQRLLRRGSVSTSAVQNRAVRDIKRWPGGPRVRPGDLTAEAVEELDGRYSGTGAFLRVAVPAQTWDGPLTPGSVIEEADWPEPAVFPKPGYFDVHLDVPVETPGEVSWSLTVDGAERVSGTTWAAGRLSGVVPTGPVEAGQSWGLVNDGAPLELGDGELVVQLVDRAGPPGEIVLPEPEVEGSIAGAPYGSFSSTTTVTQTVPAGGAGDLLVLVASVVAWTSGGGVPDLSGVTSPLAWYEVARDHSLGGASKASIWTRIAGPDDGGEQASVNFSPGGASSYTRALFMYRVELGSFTGVLGHSFDSAADLGAASVGLSPDAVTEQDALDIGVVLAQQWPAADGPPGITQPSAARWQVFDTSVERHLCAISHLSPQGAAAGWTLSRTGSADILGRVWRLRVGI